MKDINRLTNILGINSEQLEDLAKVYNALELLNGRYRIGAVYKDLKLQFCAEYPEIPRREFGKLYTSYRELINPYSDNKGEYANLTIDLEE